MVKGTTYRFDISLFPESMESWGTFVARVGTALQGMSLYKTRVLFKWRFKHKKTKAFWTRLLPWEKARQAGAIFLNKKKEQLVISPRKQQ